MSQSQIVLSAAESNASIKLIGKRARDIINNYQEVLKASMRAKKFAKLCEVFPCEGVCEDAYGATCEALEALESSKRELKSAKLLLMKQWRGASPKKMLVSALKVRFAEDKLSYFEVVKRVRFSEMHILEAKSIADYVFSNMNEALEAVVVSLKALQTIDSKDVDAIVKSATLSAKALQNAASGSEIAYTDSCQLLERAEKNADEAISLSSRACTTWGM